MDAEPARFAADPPEPGVRLRVFGYPGSPPRPDGLWVDVEVKGQIGGRLLHVESRHDQTVKAQPGFSGSPVWNHVTGEVCGLLHAVGPDDKEPARDAYLLPPAVVAQSWEDQFDYLLIPANPYRGLEPFTAEQADLFFGRDRDIETLASRVTGRRVTAVIGASGVGKTSLVRAGLVPRLGQREAWSVVLVRPGLDLWRRLANGVWKAEHDTSDEPTREEQERAVASLRCEGFGPTADLLASYDPPRRLLVIVDQLEELLAGGQSPEPSLLDLLLPAQEQADDSTRVVLTLRIDHLPALVDIPGMGPRLEPRLYLLSPLENDELRAAVEGPARASRVELDPGLVDQLVGDTGSTALPLLQFTLTRLWGTQRRRILSFAGYSSIGGVTGALDRFAEEQLSGLRPETVAVVERLLLRLVRTPAGDAGRTTRRRAYQTDMPAAEWQVAQQLADQRLVTVDRDPEYGPFAEFAHEALIVGWKRLTGVVRENADFLTWLDRLSLRADQSLNGTDQVSDPLPEAGIAEARRWLTARPDAIPEPVKQFVLASEAALEERVRELTQARDHADALRLAADAELALRKSTTVALGLATESMLLTPTLQGDIALRHVLRQHPRILARLDHGGAVWAVAFSPDGAWVATGSSDGSARVFDAATGVARARLDHGRAVWAVAFSPDGAWVATGSSDGSARVFDAATGAERARLDHRGTVESVAFSPDGAWVAAGSLGGSVRVFDAATGVERARLDHDVPVRAVAFSPDGAWVATGSSDGSARVFDAATGAERARLDHRGTVESVAFSPDGAWVAAGSLGGSVRVFDAATGVERVRLNHGLSVWSVAFSPDGAWVAAGSLDGSARVFDAATGAERARLNHGLSVWSVAFSPDGAWVATGSLDGRHGCSTLPPAPNRPGSTTTDRCGRSRSARTEPGWPPAATTGQCKCLTLPPAPSGPGSPTTGR